MPPLLNFTPSPQRWVNNIWIQCGYLPLIVSEGHPLLLTNYFEGSCPVPTCDDTLVKLCQPVRQSELTVLGPIQTRLQDGVWMSHCYPAGSAVPISLNKGINSLTAISSQATVAGNANRSSEDPLDIFGMLQKACDGRRMDSFLQKAFVGEDLFPADSHGKHPLLIWAMVWINISAALSGEPAQDPLTFQLRPWEVFIFSHLSSLDQPACPYRIQQQENTADAKVFFYILSEIKKGIQTSKTISNPVSSPGCSSASTSLLLSPLPSCNTFGCVQHRVNIMKSFDLLPLFDQSEHTMWDLQLDSASSSLGPHLLSLMQNSPSFNCMPPLSSLDCAPPIPLRPTYSPYLNGENSTEHPLHPLPPLSETYPVSSLSDKNKTEENLLPCISLDNLNEEVIMRILSFCDSHVVSSFGATCRHYFSISEQLVPGLTFRTEDSSLHTSHSSEIGEVSTPSITIRPWECGLFRHQKHAIVWMRHRERSCTGQSSTNLLSSSQRIHPTHTSTHLLPPSSHFPSASSSSLSSLVSSTANIALEQGATPFCKGAEDPLRSLAQWIELPLFSRPSLPGVSSCHCERCRNSQRRHHSFSTPATFLPSSSTTLPPVDPLVSSSSSFSSTLSLPSSSTTLPPVDPLVSSSTPLSDFPSTSFPSLITMTTSSSFRKNERHMYGLFIGKNGCPANLSGLASVHPAVALPCASMERGRKSDVPPSVLDEAASLVLKNSHISLYICLDTKYCRVGYAGASRNMHSHAAAYCASNKMKGGIFCDEPGLGKTVSMLSLCMKSLNHLPPLPPNVFSWKLNSTHVEEFLNSKGSMDSFTTFTFNPFVDGKKCKTFFWRDKKEKFNSLKEEKNLFFSTKKKRFPQSSHFLCFSLMDKTQSDIFSMQWPPPDEVFLFKRDFERHQIESEGEWTDASKVEKNKILKRLKRCHFELDIIETPIFQQQELFPSFLFQEKNLMDANILSLKNSIKRPDFIVSKATLIIVPPPLINHWISEIHKWFGGNLDHTVLVLERSSKEVPLPSRFELASSHFVICSNKVLTNEFTKCCCGLEKSSTPSPKKYHKKGDPSYFEELLWESSFLKKNSNISEMHFSSTHLSTSSILSSTVTSSKSLFVHPSSLPSSSLSSLPSSSLPSSSLPSSSLPSSSLPSSSLPSSSLPSSSLPSSSLPSSSLPSSSLPSSSLPSSSLPSSSHSLLWNSKGESPSIPSKYGRSASSSLSRSQRSASPFSSHTIRLDRSRSPLLGIYWQRLVIDEGHKMSQRDTNYVRLSREILAEKRWVMTGTPTDRQSISFGLQFMGGLLEFLKHPSTFPFLSSDIALVGLTPYKSIATTLKDYGDSAMIYRLFCLLDSLLVRHSKWRCENLPVLDGPKIFQISPTKAEMDVYNDLVQLTQRNLYCTYYSRENLDSLLHPNQREQAMAVLWNLRFSCAFVAKPNLYIMEKWIEETIQMLTNRHAIFLNINRKGRFLVKCDMCSHTVRFPLLIPCKSLHLLCTECLFPKPLRATWHRRSPLEMCPLCSPHSPINGDFFDRLQPPVEHFTDFEWPYTSKEIQERQMLEHRRGEEEASIAESSQARKESMQDILSTSCNLDWSSLQNFRPIFHIYSEDMPPSDRAIELVQQYFPPLFPCDLSPPPFTFSPLNGRVYSLRSGHHLRGNSPSQFRKLSSLPSISSHTPRSPSVISSPPLSIHPLLPLSTPPPPLPLSTPPPPLPLSTPPPPLPLSTPPPPLPLSTQSTFASHIQTVDVKDALMFRYERMNTIESSQAFQKQYLRRNKNVLQGEESTAVRTSEHFVGTHRAASPPLRGRGCTYTGEDDFSEEFLLDEGELSSNPFFSLDMWTEPTLTRGKGETEASSLRFATKYESHLHKLLHVLEFVDEGDKLFLQSSKNAVIVRRILEIHLSGRFAQNNIPLEKLRQSTHTAMSGQASSDTLSDTLRVNETKAEPLFRASSFPLHSSSLKRDRCMYSGETSSQMRKDSIEDEINGESLPHKFLKKNVTFFDPIYFKLEEADNLHRE
ncbi:SWI2/SNF2-containing protein, partial [Cardiosporidium cionae]